MYNFTEKSICTYPCRECVCVGFAGTCRINAAWLMNVGLALLDTELTPEQNEVIQKLRQMQQEGNNEK